MKKDKKSVPVPHDLPEFKLVRPTAVLVVDIEGKIFYASLCKNRSADEFTKRLESAGTTVEVRGGEREKTGKLPWNLPLCEEEARLDFGDVILCEENGLAVYLGERTMRPVCKLAKLGDSKREKLIAALGADAVVITFGLEWSE